MRHLNKTRSLGCLIGILSASTLIAGPYPPAAHLEGTTAIPAASPSVVAWATTVSAYVQGLELSEEFTDVSQALGPVDGALFHPDGSATTVSLGDGGSIDLKFSPPIRDGEGWDFAVFENGFTHTFLELGWVEVSSDGEHFVRFPNYSLTPAATSRIDATNIHGLAGKYSAGFGTPFDLADLQGVEGLDLNWITHIRIIDIIGDGSAKDSEGRPIFDPGISIASAGFDLDGLGVRHQASLDITVQTDGNSPRIRWIGRNGGTYHVQTSADGANWTTVASRTGGDYEMEEPVPAADAVLFLRIVAD